MGSAASVFEQSSALNDYNLKQKRLCAEFTITHNATPASKVLGAPDLPGVMLLRTEGQTTVVDAIETVAYTTAVDNSSGDSVMGVMIRGGLSGLGSIAKILFIRVTDRGGTATSLTVTPHGVSGLTTGGNIAFSIAGEDLSLATADADVVVEIEYVASK